MLLPIIGSGYALMMFFLTSFVHVIGLLSVSAPLLVFTLSVWLGGLMISPRLCTRATTTFLFGNVIEAGLVRKRKWMTDGQPDIV